MPFPDFITRKRGKVKRPESERRLSSGRARTSGYPLEDVSEEIYQSLSRRTSIASTNLSTTATDRIVHSFEDVLSKSDACNHFSQFLETSSESHLLSFCIDVKNFQRNAENVSKCLSDAARMRSESESCSEHDNERKRGKTRASNENVHFYCHDFFISEKTQDLAQNASEERPESPGSESIDSGIHSESVICSTPAAHASSVSTSNLTTSTSASPSTSSEVKCISRMDSNSGNCDQLTAEEQVLLNQMREALVIYQKYISPEAPSEILFPASTRNSVIFGICSETGKVDPDCFDDAYDFIKAEMEKNHFPNFTRSKFYNKYLLDILLKDEGRCIDISDVLSNDVLMFHFMEFVDEVEGRGHRSMLEFWMSVANFKRRLKSPEICLVDKVTTTPATMSAQNDAIVIYEKFISMQASSPLGFASELRCRIESKICCEFGATDPTCFDEAVQLVEQFLHVRHLQKFINSNTFKDYISELKASILSHDDTNIDEKSLLSSVSPNESSCFDDSASTKIQSSLCDEKISQNNVVLDFLDLFSDTDRLWKRKLTSITNIGRVDSLGRYTSSFELPPDCSSFFLTSHTEAMSSRITRAVKRIISISDLEKDKEETAWGYAHMIVNQVLSRTPENPE